MCECVNVRLAREEEESVSLIFTNFDLTAEPQALGLVWFVFVWFGRQVPRALGWIVGCRHSV